MRKAFTLMEVVLVLLFLSIIALLFFTYMVDVGNIAVDSASKKIQSDIRYAQQLAISTNLAHGVVFTRYGTYTVYKESSTTPAIDPMERNDMVEDISDFGNVAVGNDYRVEFDAIGRPVAGGGGSVTVVADSGAARRINVIANTGAITVDVMDEGSGCQCKVAD